jgi:rubrerythrin
MRLFALLGFVLHQSQCTGLAPFMPPTPACLIHIHQSSAGACSGVAPAWIGDAGMATMASLPVAPRFVAFVRLMTHLVLSGDQRLMGNSKGLEMDSVEIFLAHTVRLEQEAALRFEQLADAMQTAGNRDVAQLFKRLAHFSRLHLADATARSGFREVPALGPLEFEWPDIESPETAAIWAADPFIGCEEALQVALDAETAGLNFYRDILDKTEDPEIKRFALEFVAEEGQHVAELERWLGLHRSGQSLPTGPQSAKPSSR